MPHSEEAQPNVSCSWQQPFYFPYILISFRVKQTAVLSLQMRGMTFELQWSVSLSTVELLCDWFFSPKSTSHTQPWPRSTALLSLGRWGIDRLLFGQMTLKIRENSAIYAFHLYLLRYWVWSCHKDNCSISEWTNMLTGPSPLQESTHERVFTADKPAHLWAVIKDIIKLKKKNRSSHHSWQQSSQSYDDKICNQLIPFIAMPLWYSIHHHILIAIWCLYSFWLWQTRLWQEFY